MPTYMHRAGGIRADHALAYRALAAEVMEAGMHFWILHNMACAQQANARCWQFLQS